MTETPNEMRNIRVWTNGCFDILHIGHIEMLKYASSLGHTLVVGLDTDEKVRRDKGKTRPINTLSDRVEMMSSIKYVDEVVSFASPMELEDKIRIYDPDFIVVGSDYMEKPVVGSQYCREVKYFDRVGNFSTSNILGEE